MNRRGFALLAVLWILTALTALTGVGVGVARLGQQTTRNRVLLARAEWAREACGEILLARFAEDSTIHDLGVVDLGRGTSCRASLEDPGARLNVNTVEPSSLRLLFDALGMPAALADSVVAVRSRATIYDLAQVIVDSTQATRLTRFLTTRGTGVLNVNVAPAEVLRALPGLTDEAVLVLLARRATMPFQSSDELAGALSTSSRRIFLNSYAEFARLAAFQPRQMIGHVQGGVRGTPIVARATLTLVPLAGRLAVIRRETE